MKHWAKVTYHHRANFYVHLLTGESTIFKSVAYDKYGNLKPLYVIHESTSSYYIYRPMNGIIAHHHNPKEFEITTEFVPEKNGLPLEIAEKAERWKKIELVPAIIHNKGKDKWTFLKSLKSIGSSLVGYVARWLQCAGLG